MNAAPSAPASRLAAIAHAAMEARGLQPDFPADVVAEMRSITRPAVEAGLPDLRGLPWCSIDNDDSRDLDQLTVARTGADGQVSILVAIADVDALVKRGSALDHHAETNTTSVYTAAAVFPMLPLELSTDLTSLGEDQDRLAMVIDMQMSADGQVSGSNIYRAQVRNHAKLAYNAVAAWLDGTGPAPGRIASVTGLDEQLRIQDRAAQAMKALRHQQGALSLQTMEARPVFDGDALVDLRAEAANRAKELIEEFMIAANGVTARYLEAKGFASLRRVLRSPERWERIVSLAAGLGERLPATPDARALEAFLVKRRGADPQGFADLSVSVIKLLGRGEYAADLPGGSVPGHFGLAVGDYTHSTAPNRRFPDVITQRQLKAALAGQSAPYGGDELTRLAAHCTLQEDNAAKVERQVRKSAAALLLSSRIGATFDAIVTGASDKGTWVRIGQPAAEGRVTRHQEGLDVGDRVRVRLVHTDVEHGFVDFEAMDRTGGKAGGQDAGGHRA